MKGLEDPIEIAFPMLVVKEAGGLVSAVRAAKLRAAAIHEHDVGFWGVMMRAGMLLGKGAASVLTKNNFLYWKGPTTIRGCLLCFYEALSCPTNQTRTVHPTHPAPIRKKPNPERAPASNGDKHPKGASLRNTLGKQVKHLEKGVHNDNWQDTARYSVY